MRFLGPTQWAFGLLAAAGVGSAAAQDAVGLRSSLSDDGIYTLSSPTPIAPLPRPLARSVQRDAAAEEAADSNTDGDPDDPSVDGDADRTDGNTASSANAQPAQLLDSRTEPEDQAVLPVRRRPQTPIEDNPFEPLGVRAGAFLLFPSLQIGGIYTDNVAQIAHDPQDDIGLRLVPELRIQSDWVRHEFSLTANSELIFFADDSAFDETNASVNAALRLDVRHTTTANIAADYLLTETSAADSEVPDTATGRRTEHSYGFSAGVTHSIGRLSTTFTAGLRHRLFEDVDLLGGGVEDNSDRNYIEPSVSLRVAYETSPAIRPFIEAGYRPRIHEQSRDRFNLRRDSHGGFLRTGLGLELSPIWAGNVAVRYDIRDFEDDDLKTIHAFGLDGELTWRPTRLTSVQWTATTAIDESAQTDVSGARRYEGTVAVNHALRENVTIGATAGIEFTDFIGSSQEELELTGGLSLSYIVRRELELLAGYTITGFESTLPGADYIENQVTAGFRFRL